MTTIVKSTPWPDLQRIEHRDDDGQMLWVEYKRIVATDPRTRRATRLLGIVTMVGCVLAQVVRAKG